MKVSSAAYPSARPCSAKPGGSVTAIAPSHGSGFESTADTLAAVAAPVAYDCSVTSVRRSAPGSDA